MRYVRHKLTHKEMCEIEAIKAKEAELNTIKLEEQLIETMTEVVELREENQALSDMIDALLTEVLPAMLGE